MALSGVNQSHVQPVWAEIPSRSADIGARTVPRIVTLGEYSSKIICSIIVNSFGSAFDNPSALPTQNLLADPVNSRLPNQDTQEEVNIFCQAMLILNGLISI
ncbi:uncharacterized protein LOC144325098 [Podarcis muralis]